MKVVRKFVCFLFLFSILFCFACKKPAATKHVGQTAVTAAPGQFPLTDKQVELTVFVIKPPYMSDLNNNQAAKWYEDYTNVRVTYIHAPYQGARESANLHIATGEYPDIIINSGLTPIDEMNYGSQGIFIPLNDLIEEYGYWYKKAIERIPEITAAITQPDGNIYGLPNINQAFHTFHPYKAWINKDWLQKLGLAMPETTEDFYQLLKAFKTRDPNGNGRADEIPMMGYYKPSWNVSSPHSFLLNSFVYYMDNEYLAMRDGKVIFVADSEDFREGLRYIARLVNEGLLDKASFTQNVDQAKQLGTNPAAPLVGVFSDFVWWHFVGNRNDMPDRRADSYVALAPLKGPKGVRYASQASRGFNPAYAHITDNCKDPVLAFRWLEGMYSDEATMTLQLGIKGEMRDDPDPGAVGINRKPALWKDILTEKPNPPAENPYYAPMLLGNRYSDLRLGQQADWDNPNTPFEQEPKLYQETLEKYYPYRPADGEYLPININHTAVEATEVGRLTSQINTFVQENIVAFITGNKSLDRDWNAYVAEFKRLELPLYLQIKQTAYDRQYGRANSK